MKVRRGASSETKVEQQMTPMIDVVFQLLTFFIMSFKVASLEGDFNIRMPLGGAKPGAIDQNTVPPMKLRMRATPTGTLESITFNGAELGSSSFDPVRTKILGIVGDQTGPGSVRDTAEIELDCDYNLHYDYVIRAITAVSGYSDGNGGIVRLVEKVKFSPPKAGPAEG